MSSPGQDTLLVESARIDLAPLIRFRSSFSLRNGIFTPLERLRIHDHQFENIYYQRNDRSLQGWVAKAEGLQSHSPDKKHNDEFLQIIESDFNPFTVLDEIEKNIEKDLTLLLKDKGSSGFLTPDTFATHFPGVHITGNPEDIYIHSLAKILPGSVLDATSGPIVIDRNAKISPFTYLAGPVYVGPDSMVDDARITGPTVIGRNVRVGGEIENSLINDFTNKHHEGFVGHSILGSWVNLGALTTTSDLKNNYGEIRITVPKEDPPVAKPPHEDREDGEQRDIRVTEISTGRIKFGSIIADYAKTAIGTMLNTGSVVDVGANLFQISRKDKYFHPLAWGENGQLYEAERFIADCGKIMARRNQKSASTFPQMVRHTLSNLV